MLERIQGPPNTIEQNLRDAAAELTDGRSRQSGTIWNDCCMLLEARSPADRWYVAWC